MDAGETANGLAFPSDEDKWKNFPVERVARWVLARLIVVTLFALVCKSVAGEHPNLFFFFADDWGRYASCYRDLGGTESLNDLIETPNIDRIAREGVVFDNAFVPVASCGPCRASLATGRYFWNCGSGAFLNTKSSGWQSKDNPSGAENPFAALPKFGDLLRESGYYAIASRKTFAFEQSRRKLSIVLPTAFRV